MEPATSREFTYGEKMAGVAFNPSGDPVVAEIKKAFAAAFDAINLNFTSEQANEFKKDAIRSTVVAQMLAVKAATWKD